MSRTEVPDLTTIGGRVAWLKAVSGLTYDQIGRRSGLAPQTAHRLVANPAAGENVSFSVVHKLAAVFGVHDEWLGLGIGPPPKERAVRSFVAKAVAAA